QENASWETPRWAKHDLLMVEYSVSAKFAISFPSGLVGQVAHLPPFGELETCSTRLFCPSFGLPPHVSTHPFFPASLADCGPTDQLFHAAGGRESQSYQLGGRSG